MYLIIRLLSLSCIMFIVAGCANTTSIRRDSAYNSNLISYKRIVILPSHVEVNTLDASNRKERIYNYEDHLADIINERVAQYIATKGLNARLLTRKEIHEQNLHNLIFHVRQLYNPVRERLYASKLWEEKKAFSISETLGEKAKNIGEKTNSSILLMIDYAAAIKTNGARARDFAMSLFVGAHALNNADNTAMIIGLINAESGKILWTNLASLSEDLLGSAWTNLSSKEKAEKERVDKLINHVFTPLTSELR